MLRGYVPRGVEDTLIERLKTYRSVTLSGLPGIGKSTTVRQLALILIRDGYIPIIIRPGEGENKADYGFEEFIEGEKERIPYLELPRKLSDEGLGNLVDILSLLAKLLEEKELPRGPRPLRFLRRSWLWLKFKLKRRHVKESFEEYVARAEAQENLISSFKKSMDGVKGLVDVEHLAKHFEATLRSSWARALLDIAMILGQTYLYALVLLVNAAEAVRASARLIRARKEERSLWKPEKLVLIVDGVSVDMISGPRFGEAKLRGLITLENLLAKAAKVKTLYSVRIGLDDWLNYLDNRGKWLEWLVKKEEEIVDLSVPRLDDFGDIIRVNWEEPIDDERISELYVASGGLPAMALMALELGSETLESIIKESSKLGFVTWQYDQVTQKMQEIRGIEEQIEKARKEGDEEKVKKLEEEVKKFKDERNHIMRLSIRNIYNAAGHIYRGLMEKNPAYLGLITQPLGVAEEELREFCQRMAKRWEGVENIGECRWILRDERIREVKHEEWFKGERLYYRFNELWAHLPLIVAQLSKEDMDMTLEFVTVRKTLLNIMREEQKRTGEFTARILLSALLHVRELTGVTVKLREKLDLGIEWPDWLAVQALICGGEALFYYPSLGLQFSPVALKLFKESSKSEEILLYAAAYSQMLANSLELALMTPEELGHWLEKCEAVLEHPHKEPATIAHSARAYAEIAKAAEGTGDYDAVQKYVRRAEELLNKIEEMGCDKLYSVSMGVTYATLGQTLQALPWLRDKARGYLMDSIRLLKEILDNLEKYSRDEHVRSYLSLFGGEPRRKIELMAKSHFGFAQYGLASPAGWWKSTEVARKQLRECQRIFHELNEINNELGSWSMCVRLSVIEGGLDEVEKSVEELRCMWETAHEKRLKIYPVIHDVILAIYVLASLIKGGKYPDGWEEELTVGAEVYQMLIGMMHIAEEVYGLKHRSCVDEVLDLVMKLAAAYSKNGVPISSTGSLASIVASMISGKFSAARSFAEDAADFTAAVPLLRKLFGELAEALKAGELNREVFEALIKLFYLLY